MDYKKMVEQFIPQEEKIKNAISAFFSGGIIGMLAEILNIFLGTEGMLVIFIVFSALLTGIGIFDNLVKVGKMGLVIPITGFANSVASSSLDYKHEGFITGIGSNYFKLAGSVILYGIISASILAGIRSFL